MLPDELLLEIFDFYFYVRGDVTEVDEDVTDMDEDVTNVDEDVTDTDEDVTEMDEDVTEVDEDVRGIDVDEDVTDVDEDFEPSKGIGEEKWIKLAHVCRRWRSVVFQSPLRLNLQLVCTPYTRVRDTLDIWPPFPLLIYNFDEIFYEDEHELSKSDNIVAALEHNDRVRVIQLENLKNGYVTDSAAMQNPFPELTKLWLNVSNRAPIGPILPDSFLAGTAPRLQSLYLDLLPFPGLPKLLLSATHLVDLILYDIPSSGYIPHEVMATSLSALTNLESLELRFRYPRPRPALETRRPPPPPLTRSTLPSLTRIIFKGASEYWEEILARVDAPQLDKLDIIFFNQIIFDTPQLLQFISRRPTLRALEEGYIEFNAGFAIVKFRPQTSNYDVLSVGIACTVSEWQLSSLEQVCTSSLPPLSTLEDLYISEDREHPPNWQDDVEDTIWLELLHSFAAVKNLYVSKKFAPHIAPALQELVGGRLTEVLPTLENLFLEGFQLSGPLHEGIEKFVAARLPTSHPVAVSGWDGRL
jgi:hypothetical protein